VCAADPPQAEYNLTACVGRGCNEQGSDGHIAIAALARRVYSGSLHVSVLYRQTFDPGQAPVVRLVHMSPAIVGFSAQSEGAARNHGVMRVVHAAAASRSRPRRQKFCVLELI